MGGARRRELAVALKRDVKLRRPEVHEGKVSSRTAWGETVASTLRDKHRVNRVKVPQRFKLQEETSLKHVLPTRDSGRLVSTMENGQLSFPGIRAGATTANDGPKTTMTQAAATNRLNMKQNLTIELSAMSAEEYTPVKQNCLEAATCSAEMYWNLGKEVEI